MRQMMAYAFDRQYKYVRREVEKNDLLYGNLPHFFAWTSLELKPWVSLWSNHFGEE